MLIQNNKSSSQISFKGYDARALKGFLVMSNYKNIANELTSICKKEGVDVFFTTGSSPIFKNEILPNATKFEGNWAQDVYTFLKNEFLICDFSLVSGILKVFNLKQNSFQKSLGNKFDFDEIHKSLSNLESAIPIGKGIFELKTLTGSTLKISSRDISTKLLQLLQKRQNITHSIHVQGGNSFIAKNKFENEFVLLGEDELTRFKTDELKKLYNSENLAFIPQMDFHLDMFIRPLNDGKVLIADDTLTLQIIQKIQSKLFKALNDESVTNHKPDVLFTIHYLNKLTKQFKNQIEKNNYKSLDVVEKKLISLGFEPIRVPGRLYSLNNENLNCIMNFLNANTFLNKKNELVYITNSFSLKDLIDIPEKLINDLKLSFEDEFYNFIKPYVKKEHTYFVKGDDNAICGVLNNYGGGIHCLSAEIPK